MNLLAAETSPYLLQHKDNPVLWHAWNDEAWRRAHDENKMVLVSIGYSACHWCHVMEHEVFEDFECAEFMNMNFVCIKVDREERPDVDSWFMDAVHLMGSQGGWPLNVFTLPDGRPIYGGTYFPKQSWLQVLENLTQVYTQDGSRVNEYAAQLADGMRQLNAASHVPSDMVIDLPRISELVDKWQTQWDGENGGNLRAPKFPMPNNWEFLLQFGKVTSNISALNQVKNTLEKMALGGIYDQIAGGFARYSVDGIWKVPHFEKMLYDNAQLIGLYAQAYREFELPLFSEVVDQTISFLDTELKAPNGLYYSALDADTEGVEGKFYVWSDAELDEVLREKSSIAKRYFAIGHASLWEHGNHILLGTDDDEEWLTQNQMTSARWMELKTEIFRDLLHYRNNRIKPGIDDKCIASWNALLVIGLCESAKCGGKHHMLSRAEALLDAIEREMSAAEGLVVHTATKGQKSSIVLIEDQVLCVEAGLALYELTGKDQYLNNAFRLMDKVIQHFSSDDSALLLSRPKWCKDVIGDKFETQDNVIPCANSIACKAMIRLSMHLDDSALRERAMHMLQTVGAQIDYAPGFSNWLQAAMWLVLPAQEVVCSGAGAIDFLNEIQEKYTPFVTYAASTTQSELPLLQGRFREQTAIYVCRNKTCNLPVFRPDEVKIAWN